MTPSTSSESQRTAPDTSAAGAGFVTRPGSGASGAAAAAFVTEAAAAATKAAATLTEEEAEEEEEVSDGARCGAVVGVASAGLA